MNESLRPDNLDHIIFNPQTRIEMGPLNRSRRMHVHGVDINVGGNLKLSSFNNFLEEYGAISLHVSDGNTISHIAFDAEQRPNHLFRLLYTAQNTSLEWRSTFYDFPCSSLNPIEVRQLLDMASMNFGENDFVYTEISFIFRTILRTLKKGQVMGLDELFELCGEGRPHGSDFQADENGTLWDPRLLS